MSKIIMEIGPNGERTIKAEGIPGVACKDITKPFEALLGGQVISDTATSEMSLPPAATQLGTGLKVGN
jgi:hypothetical protein